MEVPRKTIINPEEIPRMFQRLSRIALSGRSDAGDDCEGTARISQVEVVAVR